MSPTQFAQSPEQVCSRLLISPPFGFALSVLAIKYFSDDGICFYLRPHKGGITAGDEDEDDDEPTCSSHVYCPFLLANTDATREGVAILTEGEFKAAAIFQCGIPAFAIPGVSFVRNPAFRAELIALIRRFGITDLVIVFDNEVKDDPAFPERYKPDPTDRKAIRSRSAGVPQGGWRRAPRAAGFWRKL